MARGMLCACHYGGSPAARAPRLRRNGRATGRRKHRTRPSTSAILVVRCASASSTPASHADRPATRPSSPCSALPASAAPRAPRLKRPPWPRVAMSVHQSPCQNASLCRRWLPRLPATLVPFVPTRARHVHALIAGIHDASDAWAARLRYRMVLTPPVAPWQVASEGCADRLRTLSLNVVFANVFRRPTDRTDSHDRKYKRRLRSPSGRDDLPRQTTALRSARFTVGAPMPRLAPAAGSTGATAGACAGSATRTSQRSRRETGSGEGVRRARDLHRIQRSRSGSRRPGSLPWPREREREKSPPTPHCPVPLGLEVQGACYPFPPSALASVGRSRRPHPHRRVRWPSCPRIAGRQGRRAVSPV